MSGFCLVDLPNGWRVGRFACLDCCRSVAHLVTTRKGLDVGLVATDRAAAAARLAEAMGLKAVAFLDQVHGDRIIEVRAEDLGGPGHTAALRGAGGLAGMGDGLITDETGLGLMGVSADCPLILAADLDGAAVGVAHASWRGTVKKIALKLIRRMAERYGVDPSRLVACIGPSAGPERYEVGPDVLAAARETLGPGAERFFPRRDGKMYFDLWQANRAQLVEAGLSEENIHVAGICTITRNDLFPSYRLEGASAGRFLAVISKT